MYQAPYYNNAQNATERIDSQIAELQKMKAQIQQIGHPVPATQPSITQTFQLAPNSQTSIRYANSIDDVNKEMVYGDTPFFSKDLSVLWLKNIKGEIKAYELKEIVQKDEKDLIIESLQMQIQELRKGVEEIAKSTNEYANGSTQSEEPTSVPTVRATKTKSK